MIKMIWDWLWRTLVTLPLAVLGWFIVPYLYTKRNTPLDGMPKWAALWTNPEDWTNGWRGHLPGDNCVPYDLRPRYQGFWGFFKYHALRNKVGGRKQSKWFTVPMSPVVYQTNDLCKWYDDWWIWKYKKPTDGSVYWHKTTLRNKYRGMEYVRYFKFRGTLYYYKAKFGWRIGPSDTQENPKSGRWKHGTTCTFQPWELNKAGKDYE